MRSNRTHVMIFSVLFILVSFLWALSSSSLAADPPLTYENIHQYYKDTRIPTLAAREENLKRRIRDSKINFVPTNVIKAKLRDEHGIPKSILDELNRHFASKIVYRLSKFECYGCPSNVNVCDATHHFRFALQRTISEFAANRPEIWGGKGVHDGPIPGCDQGQPWVDPEEHVIIDVKGEIVRDGNGFSARLKLFQKQGNISHYLGETTAQVSLQSRDQGFKEAAVAAKKYIEDVFVR